MSDVEFRSVYEVPKAGYYLYQLLAEREPGQSISHISMPTPEEHERFIMSSPYQAWYLMFVENVCVGATYLSKQREIGVGVFRAHQRKSYATQAIRMLIAAYPGKLLANFNPNNQASIELFKNFGFNLIQHTYAHE